MDFKNIDWSQYQSWQPIQTPTGGTQYLVPNTDWVYDPFVSAQTGKVQLFKNPKPAMDAQAAQEKAYKDANSPTTQLMGVGLPIAAGLGGKYLYDNYFASGSANAGGTGIGQAFSNLFGGGSSAPASSVASAVAPAATASQFASAAAPFSAAEPFMSYSTLGGTASNLANVGPTVEAAAGLGGTAPTTGLFGGIGGLGMAGLAAGALVGLSQLKGMNNFFHGKQLDTKQKLALALPTFGLSLASGLWAHKSTKEREKERWGKLANDGVTGAQEAFLAAHPEGDTGIWKDGPTAGKQWNWEDAVMRAKANPAEFRGVYGNFDTFGNDWATYAPAQQDEIVKRLINANLYDPEKGDITITDKEAARKIKDQVLAGDPETSALQKGIIPGPQLQSEAKQTAAIQPPAPPAPAAPTPGAPTQPIPGVTFKTVDVKPPAPPSPQDMGKQLADRYNMKQNGQ